jgi:hypothetical protein
MMNVSKFVTISLCTLLITGCGDNPFSDHTPIQDNDYAMIRIEMSRCNHISKEGSILANFHWSPRMACLNHLKERIVHTGNAAPEGIENDN